MRANVLGATEGTLDDGGVVGTALCAAACLACAANPDDTPGGRALDTDTRGVEVAAAGGEGMTTAAAFFPLSVSK